MQNNYQDKLFLSEQEADAMSEGPDKSCSTSFESTTDDSVLLDTLTSATSPTSPISPSDASSDNNILDGSVITLDSSKVGHVVLDMHASSLDLANRSDIFHLFLLTVLSTPSSPC